MRILLALVGIVSLAWGTYWFIGSAAMERGIVAWLEERRSENWQAEAAAVKTRGFPNRFDTTITDLELADPDSGIAWRAPFLQVFRKMNAKKFPLASNICRRWLSRSQTNMSPLAFVARPVGCSNWPLSVPIDPNLNLNRKFDRSTLMQWLP